MWGSQTWYLSWLQASLSGLKFASPCKVGAMGTPGSDAADSSMEQAEERERFSEVEHLPPLLEDEENVSLADILSLRDRCLCEEEVWAVCAECILALQSIRPSHLFYTLCITPDTLAFNAHGKVCFMEQLSDDPEGSFVPPEFDSTGSTFGGHIYSLGSTLSAALNFVIEPELKAEMGEELQNLLQQMQSENPEDRPELQDILSLAEAQLFHTSAASVCRKLSSVGRRVLSIESVSNTQEEHEGPWEARWQRSKPTCVLKRPNSEDKTKDLSEPSVTNCFSRQQVCRGWDSSLWVEDVISCKEYGMIPTDDMESWSYNSSPLRRSQAKISRAKGALNRSCSVPDSNNPPYLSSPPQGISIPVTDLTEIGVDENLSCNSSWNNRHQQLNRGKSCDSYPHSSAWDCEEVSKANHNVNTCTGEESCANCTENETKEELQSSGSLCQELETRQKSSSDQFGLNHRLRCNYMTKSMLCLNEESQDEWISLKELLARCGRRLTVIELWALCYTCLSSLQTYTDFPAYLCLDTVYVNFKGEVIFLKPKNIESYNDFYLAPEFQEHHIVTEKVCVYAVAAILWASAKFSLSANQKLAMPRKMKRLLLEMAKRTPMERPTIAMAKKSCFSNLSRLGISAEAVWDNLISRVHPPASKSNEAEDLNTSETEHSCEEAADTGFVPMATESRLAPVPDPVPHSYPELQVPEAFTSTATHFTPIILTREVDVEEEEESQQLRSASTRRIDELTRNSSHVVESCPRCSPHSPASTNQLSLKSQDLNGNQTSLTAGLKSSSSNSHLESASAPFEISHLQISSPLQLSTDLNGCGIFNNYFFQQDPTTGHLSLVPVQVKAPKYLLGLDINLSLVQPALQELITSQESSESLFIDCASLSVMPEAKEHQIAPSYYSHGSIIPDGSSDHEEQKAYNGPTNGKSTM